MSIALVKTALMHALPGVRFRKRSEFQAHFGLLGRAEYRDVVPGTSIRMHSVNMTASTFEPRIYLLYTGAEPIEEFVHAVAWLAMQDRNQVTVLV